MEDEIYKANILDHYHHPHHRGLLEAPTHTAIGTNPSCGDALTISVRIEGEKVTDIGFVGEGCAISQAATSMLTERVIGESLDEVRSLKQKDIDDLLGITVGESREKCAYLCLQTLQKACTTQ